ncbi:MAG: FecR domain-containing protein [Candidatus Ancaeobacter aquaticus]|nr:FecR domain-containing protein [Candidatus Ancaeobacter aquaticus]
MSFYKKLCVSAVAVFVAIGFVTAGSLYADDASAVISSYDGKVLVKTVDSDKWVEIKRSDVKLGSGDSIKTENGTADIVYPDGSILKIKDHSVTTITDLKDESSGQVTRRIKLFVGDMWAKITPGTSTKTEFVTPSAVAAVKGTTVSLSVLADGTVQILTEEGLVLVELGAGDSRPNVSLGDGDSIQVSVDANGNVSIEGLSGDVDVVMANGTTIAINPTNAVETDATGSTIAVTKGSVVVTSSGRYSETHTFEAGMTVTIDDSGSMKAALPSQLPPVRNAAAQAAQNAQKKTGGGDANQPDPSQTNNSLNFLNKKQIQEILEDSPSNP